VGLRLSPGNPINEIVESDPAPVYHALIDVLRSRDLAYLHLVEAGAYPALEDLRPGWPGTVVGNLSGERAMSFADGERLLNANLVDVLAYGRLFLANPDLPLRLVTGAPLAQAQRDHHYASTSEGYIDHPFADPELTALAQRLIHEPDEGDRNTAWAWG
jgi:N-ethylmaleimide reductase